MNGPPLDDLVRARLQALWELRLGSLRQVAVGFPDSFHYVAETSRGRLFLTVDSLAARPRLAADPDTAFRTLTEALEGAHALRHSAGLEFVLAPLIDHEGRVIERLTQEYSLTVFPFVETSGDEPAIGHSPRQKRLLLAALGRLHAADVGACPAHQPDFGIPEREELVSALNDLVHPWNTGPYGEPARKLLMRRRLGVAERLSRFDSLTTTIEGRRSEWVPTHGEPHTGNALWTTDGRLMLVDWDTFAAALPERDLWMVLDQADTMEESRAAESKADPEALEFYRLWWELAEIAEYTARFRRPHSGGPSDESAWEDLTLYL